MLENLDGKYISNTSGQGWLAGNDYPSIQNKNCPLSTSAVFLG